MVKNGIIGQSIVMKDVFRVLDKVVHIDATVLMTGESGTGKELLGRALHKNGPRASQSFVSVKCGALSAELMELELFGHERGTSAIEKRSIEGRLELANKGTVFLDEIGEIDPGLQVKILRLIQDKEFERVGAFRSQKINVRVIAATSIDLEKEVEKGNFREDLYYRLNVIPVILPPLRNRGGDIMLLAEYFLKKFCIKSGRRQLKISQQAKDLMMVYCWPGNVRELESFMERMAIHCEGHEILPKDLPDKILFEYSYKRLKDPVMPRNFEWPSLNVMLETKMNLREFLEEIEKKILAEALNRSEGLKNQAAEILGIKRTTLVEKLKKKKIITGNGQNV